VSILLGSPQGLNGWAATNGWPLYRRGEGAGERGRAYESGMQRFFLFALLGLAACTSAAESSEPGPASVPHAGDATEVAAQNPADRARPATESFNAAARQEQPAAFVCRKDAFCEDFEEQGFSAHWSDSITTSGGKIDFASDSASFGKGALRLSATEAGSTAFLFSEKATVGSEWSGAFSLAFRVDQIPGVYLGGPELTVKTNEGPITVRIGLKPEGLVLEQLSEATCLKDRCTPTTTILAPAQPNHWYRVRLGFEVNPHQAAPYGRIEASVDGGELFSTDLNVPFYDGSLFVRAGITQADARRAFADLDDVSLLVRP
jgi:hypothetical protein